VTLAVWIGFNVSFLADFSLEQRRSAIRKKRFSDEQTVAVLKRAEMGLAVSDLIRQLGISEQTFWRWKKQYGGLQSEQVNP